MNPSLGATSLVIRKYASWSIAQGIRQGIRAAPLRGTWKVDEKAGQACTAGKELLPMLSEPVKPKIALD